MIIGICTSYILDNNMQINTGLRLQRITCLARNSHGTLDYVNTDVNST